MKKSLPLLAAVVFFCVSTANAYPLKNGDDASAALLQPDTVSSFINSVSGASMYAPAAVARGGGRIYVCDTGNNRVLWWTESDFFAGKPAAGALGQADLYHGYANRAGDAGPATLNSPSGVTIDSSGRVWVADTRNNRVLAFSTPTASGQAAELVLGQVSFVAVERNRAGSASANTLNQPADLKADPSGNIWVADTDNRRILRYDAPQADGQAASIVLGKADFTAAEAAPAAAGVTGKVAGLAIDPAGNLWAADYTNNRILMFSAPFTSGQAAIIALGQQSFAESAYGISPTGLYQPKGVDVDDSGNLWVADTQNSRIVEFSAPFSTGQAATVVIGQDDAYSAGPNRYAAAASAGGLNLPPGILVLPEGLAVADMANNRVLRISTTTGLADAVSGQQNFVAAQPNRLTKTSGYSPNGVALDRSTGRLYAADTGNNRVLWWSSAQNAAGGKPAEGVLGQADLYSGYANRGGSPAADTLSAPLAVWADSAGNLWVADTGNNRALRFDSPIASGKAASIVLGQSSFADSSANRGAAAGADTLYHPAQPAVDETGALWIADEYNNRVLKFLPPFSTGQSANVALGQPDLAGSSANQGGGTVAAANTLSLPAGVFPSTGGRLWVADYKNNRVLAYSSPTASGQAAAIVLGQSDMVSSAEHSIDSTTLLGPASVAADADGKLWVADTLNNRLLRFDSPSLSGSAASLVLGQTDFLRNPALTPPGPNTLLAPFSIAVDTYSSVWVADTGNNRIMRFNGFSLTQLSPRAAASEDGYADLSWNGLATSSYTFTLAEDPAFQSPISSHSLSALCHRAGGLAPGRTYYFEVKLSTESDTAFSQNTIPIIIPQTTVTQPAARELKVYPVPFYPQRQTALTFSGLENPADIRIYTITADLVRSLHSETGTVLWDGRNDSGQRAASGIYIALIKTSSGTRKIKLAVEN